MQNQYKTLIIMVITVIILYHQRNKLKATTFRYWIQVMQKVT